MFTIEIQTLKKRIKDRYRNHWTFRLVYYRDSWYTWRVRLRRKPSSLRLDY